MNKQKYVSLSKGNEIIVFPMTIQHNTFKSLDPVSAGFCYIHNNHVECFGRSVSLGLESMVRDSETATIQLFGRN